MRIVSGIHRGRNIHPPKNLPVRPTTDFAKESLFNILNNRIEFDQCNVLDLFSGTGNIAYEFISRGVERITCIDSNAMCCAFIKKTLTELNMPAGKVIKMDVFQFLKNNVVPYDLIFADPPYDMEGFEELTTTILQGKHLSEEGILVVEHGPRTKLDQLPGFTEHRHYGNVHFSFFKKVPAPTAI